MSLPPPTILRRTSPSVLIAPFALVRVSGPIGKNALTTATATWASTTTDCASGWAGHAREEKLVTHDGAPFCVPDAAYVGAHRVAAICIEAAEAEAHIYGGLRVGNEGQLPVTEAIAESVANLVVEMEKLVKPNRGRVEAEIFVRGESTRRVYCGRKGYWNYATDPTVVREAVPIALSAIGGIFAGGGAEVLSKAAPWFVALGFTIASYALLVALRTYSDTNVPTWVSRGWPQ